MCFQECDIDFNTIFFAIFCPELKCSYITNIDCNTILHFQRRSKISHVSTCKSIQNSFTTFLVA